MIKKANLDNLYFTCFKDNETFILTEHNTLKFCFTCSKYDLSKANLKLVNGLVIKNYMLQTENGKDYFVEIKSDNPVLQKGRLYAFVDFPEIGKTYTLDGFFIKEPNNETAKELSSFFDSLCAKIDDTNKRLEKLEKLYKNPFEI